MVELVNTPEDLKRLASKDNFKDEITSMVILKQYYYIIDQCILINQFI